VIGEANHEAESVRDSCGPVYECVFQCSPTQMRNRTLLFGAALIFVAGIVLLSIRSQTAGIEGTFQTSPTYNPAIPYRHLFGKFLFRSTDGKLYAIREAEGMQLINEDGEKKPASAGYPIVFDKPCRVTGRSYSVEEYKRMLRFSGEESQFWCPQEADAVLDVTAIILPRR
jgi:hypothetical protein